MKTFVAIKKKYEFELLAFPQVHKQIIAMIKVLKPKNLKVKIIK